MKCPKCEGERITGIQAPLPFRSAGQYGLRCSDCLFRWRENREWPIRAQAVIDRWVNVEILENSVDKAMREINEKRAIVRDDLP